MDHLGDVLTVLIVSVFYKENSQKIQVHSRPSLRRFSRTATLIGFRTLEHLKALKHLLATLPHRLSSHTLDPRLTSSCCPSTHCPPFSFFSRSKLPVLNPGLWRPVPSPLWHLGHSWDSGPQGRLYVLTFHFVSSTYQIGFLRHFSLGIPLLALT